MGKQKREVREVQNPALLAVGCRHDVLIWREQSGVFRSMNDPERVVKVGTPGISDSVMVVAVEITPEMVGKKIGVCCFAEFKTKTGRQSEAQKSWKAAAEARGAAYRVVKTKEEIVQFVDDVQAGKF